MIDWLKRGVPDVKRATLVVLAVGLIYASGFVHGASRCGLPAWLQRFWN